MYIKYNTKQKNDIKWKNTTFCKQRCWNIEKNLNVQNYIQKRKYAKSQNLMQK